MIARLCLSSALWLLVAGPALSREMAEFPRATGSLPRDATIVVPPAPILPDPGEPDLRPGLLASVGGPIRRQGDDRDAAAAPWCRGRRVVGSGSGFCVLN